MFSDLLDLSAFTNTSEEVIFGYLTIIIMPYKFKISILMFLRDKYSLLI